MTFSSEHSKINHEQGVVPQLGSMDKIQDNFRILKISKFDISLIKMLVCYVAKMKPLVSKEKIWSRCIGCLVKTSSTNLDCTYAKSYAVNNMDTIYSMQTSRISHNIQWMLFKKIVVNNVHFMVFKHHIFLCLQFICCAFCSNLKSENLRDSVQRGVKTDGV